MSKYIYTTIYEQFTGLKPPEPKNQKPRRRRGYGHPYRMRLNMQEDDSTQERMLDEDTQVQAADIEQPVAPKPFLKPPASKSPVRKRTGHALRSRRNPPQSPAQPAVSQSRSQIREEFSPKTPEPKVTYKKRRHYSQPVMSTVPLGAERKEPQDY